MQTTNQGVTPFLPPPIGRQRPLFWKLHGGLGIFGNLSWSWNPSLSFGLKLDFGLWLTEPEILGDVGMSTLLKLGVSNVESQLHLQFFGILSLISLGYIRALIASAHVLMVLALLGCIFFRPFLLCFLAKHLRNLGSTSLRNLYLCIFVIRVS